MNWTELRQALSRRDLLRNTGLLTGGLLALGALVEKAGAQPPPPVAPPYQKFGMARTGQGAPNVDYFLLIEGIAGESLDPQHRNEIEVESFAWGLGPAGPGGVAPSPGGGRAAPQDMTFKARVSKATPALFLACAEGAPFQRAILTGRYRVGEKAVEYLKVMLREVRVATYGIAEAGGDSICLDTFALNFAKVEIEYRQLDPKGALTQPFKTGFDFRAGLRL